MTGAAGGVPRRTTCAAAAGVTMVEVVVGAVLATILFAAIAATLQSSRDTSVNANAEIDVDERMANVLRDIAEDLRTASRKGEDTNDNGTMDPGEDANGNGRLEDDWAVTTTSVTFNRVLATRHCSLPISYRRNGSTVERVEMVAAGGALHSTVIARNVTSFLVADTGEITVTLALSNPGVGGTTVNRSQAITITPRN